jgi:hypothetical protein
MNRKRPARDLTGTRDRRPRPLVKATQRGHAYASVVLELLRTATAVAPLGLLLATASACGGAPPVRPPGGMRGSPPDHVFTEPTVTETPVPASSLEAAPDAGPPSGSPAAGDAEGSNLPP